MEVDGVYEDSHVPTVFAKNEILDSLWAPNSSPSFHGSSSMVNFEDDKNTERERPFFDICKSERFNDDDEVSYEDEYSGFHKPAGKKRRLMPEQVLFLEKSFDVENKLEPDRKTQLAKQLGLQPRQVAIWFQNRRARSKTKVLEREYGSLKASYDKLKEDYDTLFKQNEAMKAEVDLLTEKLVMREKVLSEPVVAPLDLLPKNVDAASNSAKSDVFDSESSHYNTLMEGGADYSSRVFEVEGSGEFSQEEEEDGVSGLVPKIEGEEWCGDDHDLQPNSGNLGFPVQHQGTWLWQY
ncbi:hypothetical protein ABFS82_12G107200 [Erythranthe guttata]|uniref:Homeobox-leucine zipper protein n=1 Tax=Erythranthe guttata TaxID=4155 RepID=A0A022QM62_ERYGU|nr:PREDICTED: homeobox-leucine zipper protein ATHB-54-like [Erythranthe guttata]EYU28699.1 hypothetical protein MIMGU_mgv1a011043mg [Erythranthe guttata]|eukprot:XP_012847654.1 PREDICTED: homeobox-leucine zipper protein ATHB-54-like [Erythranthe guttata]